MKEQIITLAIQMILKLLTPDLLKKLMDQILDFVEEYVLGTASPIDDKLVLPICQIIRDAFDITD